MEVSSSSRKIEKFSKRLSIIFLKEFRAADAPPTPQGTQMSK
jgi:hypothetical protein